MSRTNDTGKALFVRDSSGELVTVQPGQALPVGIRAATEDAKEIVEASEEAAEEERLANRTEEEKHYDAYLAGKCSKRGNVWIADAGQASTDRAYFADSASGREAEEGERDGGKEYAPSRAHDRGAKFKRQATSNSQVAATAAKEGAAQAAAAMARAKGEGSDDEDEGAMTMNALQLANRAMELYNGPVSNMAQLDTYGNDLRLPLLERKLRKFTECFAEDIEVKSIEGAAVLRDFESLKKRCAVREVS